MYICPIISKITAKYSLEFNICLDMNILYNSKGENNDIKVTL